MPCSTRWCNAACSANQANVRKLLEEYIFHQGELFETKSVQQEKHLETLIKFIGRFHDDVGAVHTRINKLTWAVLVGAICYLLGVVGGAVHISEEITTNKVNLELHKEVCSDTRKRVRTLEMQVQENSNKILFKHGNVFGINKKLAVPDEIEDEEKILENKK